MDDLGGALRELAGHAAAPGVADPEGLWRRGRARAKRQRLSAVTALLIVAVLAVFSFRIVPEPSVAMPAGPVHAAALPSNIYAPSRWLAGVSELGPPGRLAVIAQGLSDNGFWYGISATTGEYRRLDLPGQSSEATDMHLSPDGNRIAYWITGPTRKPDFGPRTMQSLGGPLPDRPTAGLGVYDVRTGQVSRYRVRSDFGLSSGDPGVSWLGDDDLVFSFGIVTGTNTSTAGATVRWRPTGTTPVEVPVGAADSDAITPDLTRGQFVRQVESDADMNAATSKFEFLDEALRPTGRTFHLPSNNSVPDNVSVNGNLVVVTGDIRIDDDSNGVQQVLVGDLPATDGAVRLAPVGTIVEPHFLSWRTPTSVLVAADKSMTYDGEKGLWPVLDDNGDRTQMGLYQVDLENRTVLRLGRVESGVDWQSMSVASDLAGDHYVIGLRPPNPLDPRLQAGYVGGGILLLIVAAHFVVRRRLRG